MRITNALFLYRFILERALAFRDDHITVHCGLGDAVHAGSVKGLSTAEQADRNSKSMEPW
jgi:hypothetical protein